MITRSERFKGAMYLGAIGDAMGSGYENTSNIEDDVLNYYPFGKPEKQIPEWQLTDDTQLTVATCEALLENKELTPEQLARHFVRLQRHQGIKGIGASTLKAIQELQIGGHWSQVGRQGEYAAGNGAAMRMAPLAFFDAMSRTKMEELCSITHKNTEAYTGALAIIIAIRSILNNEWNDNNNLLTLIGDQLADTRVRDRLIELSEQSENITIEEVAKQFGSDGYVVNSVPFAIFAASKIKQQSITLIFDQIIASGGDTDTNCSMAGQLMGTYLGIGKIPVGLMERLKILPEFLWIEQVIEELGNTL